MTFSLLPTETCLSVGDGDIHCNDTSWAGELLFLPIIIHV